MHVYYLLYYYIFIFDKKLKCFNGADREEVYIFPKILIKKKLKYVND